MKTGRDVPMKRTARRRPPRRLRAAASSCRLSAKTRQPLNEVGAISPQPAFESLRRCVGSLPPVTYARSVMTPTSRRAIWRRTRARNSLGRRTPKSAPDQARDHRSGIRASRLQTGRWSIRTERKTTGSPWLLEAVAALQIPPFLLQRLPGTSSSRRPLAREILAGGRVPRNVTRR